MPTDVQQFKGKAKIIEPMWLIIHREIPHVRLLTTSDKTWVAGRRFRCTLPRWKRLPHTVLICGLVLLLNGCIKRYSVVDAPPPPETNRVTIMKAK